MSQKMSSVKCQGPGWDGMGWHVLRPGVHTPRSTVKVPNAGGDLLQRVRAPPTTPCPAVAKQQSNLAGLSKKGHHFDTTTLTPARLEKAFLSTFSHPPSMSLPPRPPTIPGPLSPAVILGGHPWPPFLYCSCIKACKVPLVPNLYPRLWAMWVPPRCSAMPILLLQLTD